MNKRKMIFAVIALLILIAAVGKIYFYKQNKEAEKLEAERMSVIALKDTFAEIKSVEFEKSVYDEMTGFYSMFVIMTNQQNRSIKFSYSFASNHPDEISGYMVEVEEVQMKGKTENKVKVIYSNNDEEEI